MIYYPITKEAQGINVYCKHRSKECIPAMLAQGDDTQRSQGEYSKYGHDKLTAHEESADKEISILTIPPSRKRMEKQKLNDIKSLVTCWSLTPTFCKEMC